MISMFLPTPYIALNVPHEGDIFRPIAKNIAKDIVQRIMFLSGQTKATYGVIVAQGGPARIGDNKGPLIKILLKGPPQQL